jgi:hypothetical protein
MNHTDMTTMHECLSTNIADETNLMRSPASNIIIKIYAFNYGNRLFKINFTQLIIIILTV